MRTHLSSRGQVVIPQRVRDLLKLKEGTELEIEVEDDHVILKRARTPASWRSWQGRFEGVDLTQALEEDHRGEERLDRKKGS
jgi:AbrB family looped-hinge helix DNA binding protein